MKSRKISSPLLFALVTGATISLAQVATAQPIASPGMYADGRAESLVIRARIMLSQAEQLEVLRGAGIAMTVAKVRRARAKPGCGAEAFIRGGMGACAAIRAGCVHGSDRAAWR